MLSTGGTTQIGLYDFKVGADEFGKVDYWVAKTGGYPINKRVMLNDGDIVRNMVANNTANPNVDMTGWVKTSQLLFPFRTIEFYGGQLGATDSRNADALERYYDDCLNGKGGTLLLGSGDYPLNRKVTSYCPISIKGVGLSINSTGAYSSFSDARSSGDDSLFTFINKDDVDITIGLNLQDFEVIGNERVASGIEFAISGWVTHVSNIAVRKFKKQGIFFTKAMNDGYFEHVKIIECGSKINENTYYALDMNPNLLKTNGGCNQLNFIRLHIEHTRYWMRMRNWLCSFFGCHFEIGTAGKVTSSLDYTSPMIDVGPVSYPNTFTSCNFIYPTIWLFYLANGKVGGADFFNNCASVFGSTLTDLQTVNPFATNLINLDSCSFIPNGGTPGLNADNRYDYGYRISNLPYTQIKLNNCSLYRLVSNNYGGYFVANKSISLVNNKIHFHSVTQSQIDADPENATLLTGFKTTSATNIIFIANDDAEYSTIVANAFSNASSSNLIKDTSQNSVSTKDNFVISANSGIKNKILAQLPTTVRDQTAFTIINSNKTFQLDFTGSAARKTLADTNLGTYYVTQTTDTTNRIHRYMGSASLGLYERVDSNGYHTYPVTNKTGSLGLQTNIYANANIQDLKLYPTPNSKPSLNGQLTFELVSNTQLKIYVQGDDGVVRSSTLTLT